MAWLNTQETHNSALQINGTDPIRLAASETQVFGVVRRTAQLDGLQLVELNADGSTYNLIGSLFVGIETSSWEVDGLTWDRFLGALRVLLYNTNTRQQFLYQVSTTSGQASAPQRVQGSIRFKGLTRLEENIITQGPGTSLYDIVAVDGRVACPVDLLV